MKPAIEIENLSKVYSISHESNVDHNSLRDTIVRTLSKPAELFIGHRLPQEQFWAVKNVSLQIDQGDVVGIIGRNGSGKSTLLKMLSRIVEPTSGRAVLRGRSASLLEVGTGFHPELTGRENIYFNGSILGMSKKEITSKFDEIVAFSEIEKFLDTPVKFYSSGMYVRLAFSVAAHLEPEILIVDEVLAVGDADFQKKCLGKMNAVANEGRTVLFVSHSMEAVANLCNKGIHMHNGTTNGVMPIAEAISLYNGVARQPVKEYQHGPVTKVEVRQESERLVIEAHYNTDEPVDLPSLGFVIKSSRGQALMGGNPRVYHPKKPPTKSKSKGIARTVITQPALLNGTYSLSLWFGDSRKDIFSDDDALSFQINGMSANQEQPADVVGPIEPTCTWEFD